MVVHYKGATSTSRFAAAALPRKQTKPRQNHLQRSEVASPFDHSRTRTRKYGTLLCFKTQNIIRAGKATSHSGGIYSLLYYIRRIRKQPAQVAAIGVPNVVISGRFSRKIDWEKTIALPYVTHTSKFPGAAITVPAQFGQESTPEVFQRESRFIIPGVRSPDALAGLLRWLQNNLCWETASQSEAQAQDPDEERQQESASA